MPSIIFVIYSGHKAREKSKLESEAKKRQKERAQRGPDGGQRSGQVQSAAANFAQSASTEVKTPKPKKRTPRKLHGRSWEPILDIRRCR